MRLRLVKIDGEEVEVGQPYLLMAIPRRQPPKPGEIPTVGQQPVQMVMQPCQLQIFDEAASEWVAIEAEKEIELAQA